MLKRLGTAVDYMDLIYQYMSFLTTQSVVGDGIDSWLIIDPRLNSFYGSTMVIPTGSYTQVQDEVKIWVDMAENVLIDPQYSNFYDDLPVTNGEYNNLFDTLEWCYPNAIIERISSANNTLTGIENLYARLQATSPENWPDIVFSFGLFTTLIANGNSWDNYVNIELNNLFFFCKNNGIKLYCCAAPLPRDFQLYDTFYNTIESFISNTGERIINLPNIFVDMFGNLIDFKSAYTNYVYSYSFRDTLIRRLFQEYLYFDRPEFYVSFEYRAINSNSYKDFLYNYKDYQSEEFDKTENGYYDHERKMTVERKIASKNDAKNPFYYSGQLVAVGLHTSYDHKLWMCEQGGVTCKKEADAQINDIDLLPFWQFWGGGPQKRRDIPVYPGTGCPWLTISSTDISKYGVNSSNPINYYFTKDKYSSTITVRICDSNYRLPDVWQSIEFGMFTDTNYGIQYPLYVGGGNLALFPDWWLYFATSHTYGQLYNLSMKNPALCNSNILHTTKFGRANLSNFRVMDESGFWRDIYSAYQAYKDIQYFVLAGVVYEWAEAVLEHTYNYSFNTGAELVDTRDKIGLLEYYRDSNNLNKVYDKYYERDTLDTISVQINSSLCNDLNLSNGVIPKVYSSWARRLPQGINVSNGRCWLAVPNGWEDRLWHYKFYYGRIYWEGKNEKSEYGVTQRGLEQIEYVRDEWHDLVSGKENKKMITDKLVIDFGKAPVECNNLVINFPEDYPTYTDKGLLVRFLVHMESDILIICLYAKRKGIMIDYGDGNVEELSLDTRIQHQYNTTGDFYVNIYIGDANISYYHSLLSDCDPSMGLVYSDDPNTAVIGDTRDNVLKEMYISPYTPNAIYYNNSIISSANSSAVIDSSSSANSIDFHIFEQNSLEKLYLPYLFENDTKINGTIGSNKWYQSISIIDCNNLSDIYIFNDYAKKYNTVRQKNRILIIDVLNINEQDVNIHICDGIHHIFVNDQAFRHRSWESLVNSSNSLHEYVHTHLYLYNKTLVNIGNDTTSLHKTQSFGIKTLHVPQVLLADYQNAYGNSIDIDNIIGDIL